MEEQLTQLTGALLLGVVAFAYLALRSWRNQAIEQERAIGELASEVSHRDSAKLEGFYVATTEHDEPLKRIKSSGLGMRGRATLEYSPAGISIWRTGEAALHIPVSAVKGLDRASAVIDRAVESGGLTRISLTSSSATLDTYFRFSDAASQRSFNSFFDSVTTGLEGQGDPK